MDTGFMNIQLRFRRYDDLADFMRNSNSPGKSAGAAAVRIVAMHDKYA